jgi:putative membrane protein insertion efficiency factor
MKEIFNADKPKKEKIPWREKKEAEERKRHEELLKILYPGREPLEVEPLPVLDRPFPRYFRVALLCLLALAITASVGVAARLIAAAVLDGRKCAVTPSGFGWIFSSVTFVLILFFRRKHICIWAVKLYQYYAPSKVRWRCVYTPSCSHYMIMAIEKYGVIRGVIKGCKRLKRCKRINGGGEDYP